MLIKGLTCAPLSYLYLPHSDIFGALTDGKACVYLRDLLVEHIRTTHPDVELIVGLDSRGFLFNMLLATELGVGCAPVRKKGKLAGDVVSVEYKLEYGSVSNFRLILGIDYNTYSIYRTPLSCSAQPLSLAKRSSLWMISWPRVARCRLPANWFASWVAFCWKAWWLLSSWTSMAVRGWTAMCIPWYSTKKDTDFP